MHMTFSESDKAAIEGMAPGAIKRQSAEASQRDAWHASLANKSAPAGPEWVEFEGVDVLRIGDAPFLAVPVTGRKSAKNFLVLDVRDRRGYITQLTKAEVYGWLVRSSKSQD